MDKVIGSHTAYWAVILLLVMDDKCLSRSPLSIPHPCNNNFLIQGKSIPLYILFSRTKHKWGDVPSYHRSSLQPPPSISFIWAPTMLWWTHCKPKLQGWSRLYTISIYQLFIWRVLFLSFSQMDMWLNSKGQHCLQCFCLNRSRAWMTCG